MFMAIISNVDKRRKTYRWLIGIMREEHNICKNRRNYGDSPVYLNPLGFLAGNPATLVVGGSGYEFWPALYDKQK